MICIRKKKLPQGDVAEEILALIPELCYPVGISPQIKNNFQHMKTLANEMRLEPIKRIQRLNQFSKILRDSQSESGFLNKFNLSFESNLLNLKGCELDVQDIRVGNNVS